MIKRLISPLLLLSYFQTLAFQFAAYKPTANITINAQYYNFTLGKNFEMKPVIDLESSLSYVFCEGCNAVDKCRKGKPPVIFDPVKNGAIKDPDNKFSYKLPGQPDQLTGDLYSADFTIADLKFKTPFGCISSGSKNFQLQDMAVGLGFGNEGMKGYTEPIHKIFDSTKERGILIKNGKRPGDGYVVFGATNDVNCLGVFSSEAQQSTKGQQMWWLKFTRIVSGKGEETDVLAGFDFTTDDLTLPKSLYDAIGTDSVPDLKSLQDIVFELGDHTIILHPKDYTTKTAGGRYQPNIQQNIDDSPTVKLGASFYRDRCIILSGVNNAYKIGLSQILDDNSVGQMDISVILLTFSCLIGIFNHFL